MIARVTLEIALQKEFDYLIPEELEKSIEVGSRVKVPFGPRKVLGYVTGILSESSIPNLKPVISTIGSTSLVTPAVLKLARWIAGYYCCPVEIALKSVLPEAVRKEKAGWRERLFVHLLPFSGDLPKLTKRQMELFEIIQEWRELPLQELLKLSNTTTATVRKLEDKGLVTIGLKISERDPYAKEHLLPTEPLKLNETQAVALKKITEALDDTGSNEASTIENAFLLHGVTGSGKTEI
jgi:primosomal protein N' (replication factor Y)